MYSNFVDGVLWITFLRTCVGHLAQVDEDTIVLRGLISGVVIDSKVFDRLERTAEIDTDAFLFNAIKPHVFDEKLTGLL